MELRTAVSLKDMKHYMEEPTGTCHIVMKN